MKSSAHTVRLHLSQHQSGGEYNLSYPPYPLYIEYKVSRLRLYKLRVLKYYVENKAQLET